MRLPGVALARDRQPALCREVAQTKKDSVVCRLRGGGRSIRILSIPKLALGLQSNSHAEAGTTEQPTVSKTVSG